MALSPRSLQSRGSSSLSRNNAQHSGTQNPIRNMVNEYYAKQQAAYMQNRRRHDQTASTNASSLAVSPPPPGPAGDNSVHPSSSPQSGLHGLRNNNTSASLLIGIDASAIAHTHDVSTTSTTGSTPPVDRLLKWSERREEALQKIRAEEERKQAASLTFRPDLAAARHGGDTSSNASNASSVGLRVDTHSAMTDSPVPQPSTSRRVTPPANYHLQQSAPLSVSDRLIAQGALSEIRKEYQRDNRNREIESLHTFQPTIHHHHSSSNEPRGHHRDPTELSTAAWDYKRGAMAPPPPPDDPECTFRPVINPPDLNNNALILHRFNFLLSVIVTSVPLPF